MDHARQLKFGLPAWRSDWCETCQVNMYIESTSIEDKLCLERMMVSDSLYKRSM